MRLFRTAFLAILALTAIDTDARAQTISTFFRQPFDDLGGIAFDGAGNFYVVNGNDNTITKVASDGTPSLFAQAGANNFSAIAADAAGNVYVADTDAGTIVKIAPGGTMTTIAGAAQGISGPAGLAMDGSGNLYVANATSGSISKITPAGAISALVAPGGLAAPTALAADSSGNLWLSVNVPVGPPGGPVIRGFAKVDPTGAVTTFAAECIATSIAVGSNGDIYCSDGVNNVIGEMSPTGTYIGGFASGDGAYGLAARPDGSIYFSGNGNSGPAIDRLDPAGTVSQVANNPLPQPIAMVAAPGGGFYVADQAGTIGKIDATGVLAPVATVAGASFLAADKSGNLYVSGSNGISKVAPDGGVSLVTGDYSGLLATDSHGNLFIGQQNGYDAQVTKIVPGGTPGAYATVTNGGSVVSLAIDAQDNLYFSYAGIDGGSPAGPSYYWPPGTEKVTPAGAASLASPDELPMLTPESDGSLLFSGGYGIGQFAPDGATSLVASLPPYLFTLRAMALDADGNIYLLQNSIYKVVLPPSPLLSAILPGERTVAVGAPASVFATLLNTGATDLTGCAASLPTIFGVTPPSMTYQTTDPATNTLTGVPGQPATIPAGGSQTFALSFMDASAWGFADLPILFDCSGVSPAPAITAIGTVDLNFTAGPAPDIIALAATTPNDGVVTVPLSQGGAGAFAVASIDNGAAASISVSADTGTAILPITALVCQTNPSTAQCLAPPAASAQASYRTNGTATFSIFVTATSAVPLDPAASRIFVRFKDAQGTTYGWTSVAVRTN